MIINRQKHFEQVGKRDKRTNNCENDRIDTHTYICSMRTVGNAMSQLLKTESNHSCTKPHEPINLQTKLKQG